MKVRATKTVVYEISVQHQKEDDPDDGQRAGYWAWVGPPDDQSDFVVGPYKTAADARHGAVIRLEQMDYKVTRV